MEKKYIAIDDAIVMWTNIVSNGPIDKLPHVRKIVGATVNKHSTKDLSTILRALISICEINETHGLDCGSDYYCDTCKKRRSIHRSLKNYISKLRTIIENE
jgi:hypothetical protein